jgi:hypothetical protein
MSTASCLERQHANEQAVATVAAYHSRNRHKKRVSRRLSTDDYVTLKEQARNQPRDGDIRTRREVLMNHNPCGLSTEPAAEAIRN